MGKVINIFDAKKRAEKKNDTAGYNFAEVMKKNAERDKKQKQERLRETQELAKNL